MAVLRTSRSANATNAAASVTIPISAYKTSLSKIWFGYDGTPTGGRITIAEYNAANELVATFMTLPVTAGGPQMLELTNGTSPLLFDGTAKVVVTLAAGGSGVRGDLTVMQ